MSSVAEGRGTEGGLNSSLSKNLLAAHGRIEAAQFSALSMYVTFVGFSQANPSAYGGSRRASLGCWAAGRMMCRVWQSGKLAVRASTGGLAVFPAPGPSVQSGQSILLASPLGGSGSLESPGGLL